MEFLKANRDDGDVALQIREAVKVRPELTSDVFSLMKLEIERHFVAVERRIVKFYGA